MSAENELARRLRVCYGKDGRLAYLGHLEVMGTIMRSVRRCGLPFEVSNGFAHRMRIQFSQALPVGASSSAEYYDLMLPCEVNADEALEALRRCTPAALAPKRAALLPRRMPALEAWANRASWLVLLPCAADDAGKIAEAIDGVRARGVISFMRGDKPRRIELGRTLVACELRSEGSSLTMLLETRSTEQGSLRPAVLVQEVCGRQPRSVCRVGQWHEEDDGTLTSPL